jgi:hypothetical protein
VAFFFLHDPLGRGIKLHSIAALMDGSPSVSTHALCLKLRCGFGSMGSTVVEARSEGATNYAKQYIADNQNGKVLPLIE